MIPGTFSYETATSTFFGIMKMEPRQKHAFIHSSWLERRDNICTKQATGINLTPLSKETRGATAVAIFAN